MTENETIIDPIEKDLPENVESPACDEPIKAAQKEDRRPFKSHGDAKIAAQLAAAKAQVETAQKQMAAEKEKLMRTLAEYDNFRKRSTREHDAAFTSGMSHAALTLLPVIDTLQLAAKSESTDETYKKGVLMTLAKCEEAFKALGIEEIASENAVFDPNLHAAVMQQAAPEGIESGTILQVLQKGYRIQDKIIRHATVIVAE